MVTRFVSRRATEERWIAALQRANKNGVDLFQIGATGITVATSCSTPGTAYRVDAGTCECAAALAGDPVCLHRAKFRESIGLLTIPVADGDHLAAAIVELRLARCGWCRGCGSTYTEGSFFPSNCTWCDGTGERSALAPVTPIRETLALTGD